MGKKLIAYFSAGGNTRTIAERLANVTGADLFEIEPEVLYTTADLDWRDANSRSSLEMKDPSSRPAMKQKTVDPSPYDLIFIGYPVWWYTAPHIIHSFLEAHDFSGKKIVLFATSGGSGFGNVVSDLQTSVSDNTEIVEGALLNGEPDDETLRQFAARF